MLKGTVREAAAEFIGTLFLMIVGLGVNAQATLSHSTAGSMLSINFAWGFAVMIGIYIAAGVSGAHLNPAVTVALAANRRFPWSKVLPFTLAQVAGAFVAAAIVFATYHAALAAFEAGVRAVDGETGTARIVATYPQPFLPLTGGYEDQLVGTAILMVGVLAVTDPRNAAPPIWLVAPIVGLIVVAIGMAFGFNAGYAINPARDFGPRLFTFVAGWGGGVFSAGHNYWWVPIVAPCAGATAGAWLYQTFISAHHAEAAR